jgi:hypothetical protein
MCFHKSNIGSFVIPNKPFLWNKYLGHKITRCLFQSINNTLQHLWLTRSTNKSSFIENKLSNKFKLNCIVSKLIPSNSNELPNSKHTFSTSKMMSIMFVVKFSNISGPPIPPMFLTMNVLFYVTLCKVQTFYKTFKLQTLDLFWNY